MTLKRQLSTIKIRHDFNSFPVLIVIPKEAMKKEKRKKRKKNEKEQIDENTIKIPTWLSANCSNFIIRCNGLLRKDVTQRKQSQCRRTLPGPVKKMIDIFEAAEKAAGSLTTMTKQTDAGTGPNSLKKFYVSDFPQTNIQLDLSKILQTHSCPECNHFSLAPIESNEEIKAKNDAIRAKFQRKVHEYENIHKKQGTKPHAGKTICQTLACFCFQQNCFSNPNGNGCFKCSNGTNKVQLVLDPR